MFSQDEFIRIAGELEDLAKEIDKAYEVVKGELETARAESSDEGYDRGFQEGYNTRDKEIE